MAAARLPIRVEPAGGAPFGGGQRGAPTMVLHRPGDFYRRIGANGLIGFGESYMAGDWDCDDLAGLLTLLCTRIDRVVPRSFQWLRRLYVARPPADWDATEEGARRNVHQHYDLSNDMFALFLDESMSYSAALFADDGPGSSAAVRREPGSPALAGDGAAGQLAAAQRRKIDRILDQARVAPGSRVLEIGTGWGELAIRAAARGALVHSVTLSSEQAALARRRIAAAGLSDRATVGVQDYREVTGQFDAIVSVEMIEAVSERYWPDYFRRAGAAARPRRPDRAAGDHDAASPDDGHALHQDLDSQVHLPRRAHPVGARRSRTTCASTPGWRSPGGTSSALITRGPWRSGRQGSRRPRTS